MKLAIAISIAFVLFYIGIGMGAPVENLDLTNPTTPLTPILHFSIKQGYWSAGIKSEKHDGHGTVNQSDNTGDVEYG